MYCLTFFRYVTLFLTLPLFFGGCSYTSELDEHSSSLPSDSSIVDKTNNSSSREQINQHKIPLEDYSLYFDINDSDSYYNLSQQLICDDETAYMLAIAIKNTLAYGQNVLKPFDDVQTISQDHVIETAIIHTTPIKIAYTYSSDVGLLCPDYPSHPIVSLMEEELEKGNFPTNIFYAEDVREIATKIFEIGRAHV